MQAHRPEVHDGLRRALRRLVVDGADAAPNYSVQLAERPGDFHFLTWGGCTVVRTRDAARLVRAVLAHLGGHREPGPHQLRLPGVALVRDGVASIGPVDLRTRLARIERRLRARGFAVVDGPWVDVDVAAGTLVVVDHGLAVDTGALDDLVALAPAPPSPDLLVGPGAYPIATWTVADGAGGATRMSAAEATFVLGPAAGALRDPAQLAALGELLRRADVVRGWAERPEDLVDLLDRPGRAAR